MVLIAAATWVCLYYRLTCIFNVAFLYLKWTTHYLWSKLWKKKKCLCSDYFWWAIGFAWYVSKVLRGQFIYTIWIEFCTVTDFSMVVAIPKKKKSFWEWELWQTIEEGPTTFSIWMLETLNNKRVHLPFLLQIYRLFYYFLWLKNVGIDTQYRSGKYHHFIFSLNTTWALFFFLEHLCERGYWYHNNTEAQSFNPITYRALCGAIRWWTPVMSSILCQI